MCNKYTRSQGRISKLIQMRVRCFPQSLADMFKPAEGSWECTGCYVSNAASVLRCLACQTLKPGAKPQDSPSTAATDKEDPFAVSSKPGGFAGFGGGGSAGGGAGGFRFGSAAPPTVAATPSASDKGVPVPAPASSTSTGGEKVRDFVSLALL